MVNDLLNEARQFLVEYLRGKQQAYERTHPWRQDWEFAVMHALRVETYVNKILQREPHDLSERDLRLLRLAAILHDIGRMESTDKHASLGAEIVAVWLSEKRAERLTEQEKTTINAE